MRIPEPSIAFYGFLGTGNLGNDASLETALAWFRDKHPQVRIRCITLAGSQVEARYQIPVVSLASGVHWLGQGLAGKLAGRISDVPRSLRLARTADAVVVPGMGVLEETLGVTPWGFPTWMFLLALACKIRRRPFALVCVGAERAQNPLTRWLFSGVVRLASHVSYRDMLSRDAMLPPGATGAATVAPDIVFAHPVVQLPSPEPGLVVAGVMAYYGRDDDPVRGKDVGERYRQSMARALTELVNSGSKVVLVGGDRVDTEVARQIERAVARACGGVSSDAVTVREISTFDELSQVMSRAEVVIASRYHNLICALKLARPAVSIGYAEKNAELMSELGLADYCQAIEELDPDMLVTQVQQARAHAGELSEQIEAQTEDYGVRVRHILCDVARQFDLAHRPQRSVPMSAA